MKCYVCGDKIDTESICEGCAWFESDNDSTRVSDPELYQTSPGDQ